MWKQMTVKLNYQYFNTLNDLTLWKGIDNVQ